MPGELKKEYDEALASLLASFIDLLRGYPVRELHEPPRMSVDRAMKLLPLELQREIEVPEDL
jgi:hypothetical protein